MKKFYGNYHQISNTTKKGTIIMTDFHKQWYKKWRRLTKYCRVPTKELHILSLDKSFAYPRSISLYNIYNAKMMHIANNLPFIMNKFSSYNFLLLQNEITDHTRKLALFGTDGQLLLRARGRSDKNFFSKVTC